MTDFPTISHNGPIDFAEIERRARMLRGQAVAGGVGSLRRWFRRQFDFGYTTIGRHT